jgi:signal transduction histidine kinase
MSIAPARQVVKSDGGTNNQSRFSFSRIIEAAKQEATGAKTSSYLVTTATTGLIYVIVSLFIISITPTEYLLILWVILSFIFAISFSPIRYAMEELLRQLFPSIDYDAHALVKRLNTISYSSLTLNDLSRLFFQDFMVSFDVPESAFIFVQSQNYLIKTSDHFTNLHSLQKEEIDTLFQHLSHEMIATKKLKNDTANKILKAYHIRVITPLTNNNVLVGLLLLGAKYSQKPYTTKDLKVLNAIAPKIGFAIKNARSHERVQHRNLALIEELREANEKLRQANRQLRTDDKLKDEFVYVATHELKNPVTAMKGYLSLIKEGTYGNIPDKLQGPIDQLDSSNQQLIALLNNLLQIARAEAQKLVIDTTPIIICKVIDEVIHDLKPLADQKNIQIIHSCKNPSISVMAHRERAREIINNLVSNAIKYSDRGVIDISHEINQDMLVTHVKDQGVGISLQDQKKMFTRFFRVEEEAAKGIPGTGLGLFIVKQLIEKMGGRIWFTSKLNEGSDFSFSLPLAHTYSLKTE